MKKLYLLGLLFCCNYSYSMDQSAITEIMEKTKVNFDTEALSARLSNSGFRCLTASNIFCYSLGRFSPMSLAAFMPIVIGGFNEYWQKSDQKNLNEKDEKELLIKIILTNQPDAIEVLKQTGHLS